MPKVVKRTFSLTEEQAAFIDEKVRSGAYASGSEVLRAAIRSVAERDRLVETWLREQVVPVMDRYKDDPSLLLDEREASEVIERHQKLREAGRNEAPKARVRA
jgi:antitoxin ParD1/3/4